MISKDAFKHYLVGDNDIDNEHWELISKIGEFSESTSINQDIKILDAVVDLWEKHSIKEEIAMKKIKFPYSDWHIKEHELMMARFKKSQGRCCQ